MIMRLIDAITKTETSSSSNSTMTPSIAATKSKSSKKRMQKENATLQPVSGSLHTNFKSPRLSLPAWPPNP